MSQADHAKRWCLCLGGVFLSVLATQLVACDAGDRPSTVEGGPPEEAASALARPAEGPRLRWPPPTLDPPVRRVDVPPEGGGYGYPSLLTGDCVVTLPSVPVRGRVDIWGCHDVVLVGGEIRIGGTPRKDSTKGVGIWLRGFTGTAHLEGVRFRGSGLTDAIWVSSPAPGATAQIENVRVDAVHGVYDEPIASCSPPPPGPHPDLIQLFQGPETLRLDRFTGHTTYEGIFDDSGDLAPRRFTERLVIRNSNIELLKGRCGAVSVAEGSPTHRHGSPTELEDFYVEDNGRGPLSVLPRRADDPSWWGKTIIGSPPKGDFAPASRVGIGYRSPGYRR